MDIAELPAPHRERSGRESRRSARAGGPVGNYPPYIMRNIPPYDILSEENLLKIEKTAERILAEIGIEFRDDPAALELWRKAGAQVDGVRVKFPPGMLHETLKTAPSSFTQHARNPAKSVQIGGKSVASGRESVSSKLGFMMRGHSHDRHVFHLRVFTNAHRCRQPVEQRATDAGTWCGL